MWYWTWLRTGTTTPSFVEPLSPSKHLKQETQKLLTPRARVLFVFKTDSDKAFHCDWMIPQFNAPHPSGGGK
jgi:hypothetical protein